MAIDREAVRRAYFAPPDEEFRSVPTREERMAAGERLCVQRCIERGGDPAAEGLGEHGALIGGPGKPPRIRIGHVLPLEDLAPPRLAPPSWFHDGPSKPIDPSHPHLRLAIAGHMAGVPRESRPSPEELFGAFTSAAPDEMQRFWLHAVLASAPIPELRRIMLREGISRRDMVRAMHEVGAVRRDTTPWLNQFARPSRDAPQESIPQRLSGPS